MLNARDFENTLIELELPFSVVKHDCTKYAEGYAFKLSYDDKEEEIIEIFYDWFYVISPSYEVQNNNLRLVKKLLEEKGYYVSCIYYRKTELVNELIVRESLQ